MSVTGTSPGPTTAGPVWASASGTATVVTAVARLVTPALFKKSLRLTDMRGIIARGLDAGDARLKPSRYTCRRRLRAAHAERRAKALAERVRQEDVMQARRDFLRQVLPVGAATAVAFKTEWLRGVVCGGAAGARTAPGPGCGGQGGRCAH